MICWRRFFLRLKCLTWKLIQTVRQQVVLSRVLWIRVVVMFLLSLFPTEHWRLVTMWLQEQVMVVSRLCLMSVTKGLKWHVLPNLVLFSVWTVHQLLVILSMCLKPNKRHVRLPTNVCNYNVNKALEHKRSLRSTTSLIVSLWVSSMNLTSLWRVIRMVLSRHWATRSLNCLPRKFKLMSSTKPLDRFLRMTSCWQVLLMPLS